MSSNLRLARIAAIGALVAALGLAGCGRKGGLDPPPGRRQHLHSTGAESRQTFREARQSVTWVWQGGRCLAVRRVLRSLSYRTGFSRRLPPQPRTAVGGPPLSRERDRCDRGGLCRPGSETS